MDRIRFLPALFLLVSAFGFSVQVFGMSKDEICNGARHMQRDIKNLNDAILAGEIHGLTKDQAFIARLNEDMIFVNQIPKDAGLEEFKAWTVTLIQKFGALCMRHVNQIDEEAFLGDMKTLIEQITTQGEALLDSYSCPKPKDKSRKKAAFRMDDNELKW